MPTYDYKCSGCDHEWELFQSIKANRIRKCPGCGKLKAKRVIGSGAGIIFKGSGFYQTDYRSQSYKKGAEAEKKAREAGKESSSDSKKKESSTDSKTSSNKD
jgi:putative FmdB family regulatory protein